MKEMIQKCKNDLKCGLFLFKNVIFLDFLT